MHGEHHPPLRRAAPRRLPPAHMQRATAAKLRRLRVAVQIRHVEHHQLPAAQPPRIGDLEQRRIPKRRQRPLPPARSDPVDLLIGVIEEPLQLLASQRATPRPALELRHVRRRVPLMADQPGRLPEALLALLHPPVPRIAHERDEQRQDPVIAADRRMRRPARPQRRREPLHILRTPPPRVLVRELGEPSHQPQAAGDRRLVQQPAALLRLPPGEHPVEHRPLRIELNDALSEHQVRRASDVNSPRHNPIRFPNSPQQCCIQSRRHLEGRGVLR